MANGFDRLERFFTKRKGSAASTDSAERVLRPVAPEPQFPSPSFIRPKATRMAAREEVVKKSCYRRPSESESYSPERKESIATQRSTSTKESYSLYPSPRRSSPFRYRQPELLISDLRDFQFPRPPTHNGEISPASSTSEEKSSLELFGGRQSPRSQSPLKFEAASQSFDTPPTSDFEDDEARSPHQFRNKKLPPLPCAALPTPEPSPELSPVKGGKLRGSKSIEVLNRTSAEDSQSHLAESVEQPALRRISSFSSLAPSLRLSLSSSTLREPDFNDFLNLSDDDIAEEATPESPVLPQAQQSPSHAPSVASVDTAASKSQNLITLTPPYASRPATAAAFEAARIASRYNFDLVYVVNLWPDSSARPKTSSPASPDTASVHSDMSQSSKGMTGRLLAAYGLQNVKSPFQISSSVHGKILRSEGWIEYRNQDARTDEFARGYACAFYTGQYSRNGTLSSTPVPNAKTMVDRGIVFAAYRKPRADGNVLGVGSSKAELEDVHRDAEALVEMLIDIHVANRLRQPLSLPQHADETGPMPMPLNGMQ